MNKFCDDEKSLMSVVSNVLGMSVDVIVVFLVFNDSDINQFKVLKIQAFFFDESQVGSKYHGYF